MTPHECDETCKGEDHGAADATGTSATPPPDREPCKCGAIMLERWCGTYTMAGLSESIDHTRAACVTIPCAAPSAAPTRCPHDVPGCMCQEPMDPPRASPGSATREDPIDAVPSRGPPAPDDAFARDVLALGAAVSAMRTAAHFLGTYPPGEAAGRTLSQEADTLSRVLARMRARAEASRAPASPSAGSPGEAFRALLDAVTAATFREGVAEAQRHLHTTESIARIRREANAARAAVESAYGEAVARAEEAEGANILSRNAVARLREEAIRREQDRAVEVDSAHGAGVCQGFATGESERRDLKDKLDHARAVRDAAESAAESAREALRECQQGIDDDGTPCWCCIPSMIPYRGHDSGCLAARAALAASPGPGRDPEGKDGE